MSEERSTVGQKVAEKGLKPGDYLAWPECTKSSSVHCMKRHHPMDGNESSTCSDKQKIDKMDADCCCTDTTAGNEGARRMQNLLQVPRHQTRYVTNVRPLSAVWLRESECACNHQSTHRIAKSLEPRSRSWTIVSNGSQLYLSHLYLTYPSQQSTVELTVVSCTSLTLVETLTETYTLQ